MNPSIYIRCMWSRSHCPRLPDPALLERLLVESPLQLVKFKAYKRDSAPPSIDRRLTRVRNRSRMPLGAWAKWLVERILLSITGGGPSDLSRVQWNLSIEDTIGTQLAVQCTVEPLYRGHHSDQAGCPALRGVPISEIDLYTALCGWDNRHCPH